MALSCMVKGQYFTTGKMHYTNKRDTLTAGA